MAGSTLITDWIGYGDAADIPVAATLDALLTAGSTAFYLAGDTGDLSALDRDTVTWIVVATAGGSGITQLTGDVTAGPGSGSQVATIADDAVTTSKILDDAVTTAKVVDAAMTNAKLADMAAQTIKANVTGSTAAPQDADPSDVAALLLPFIPGNAFVITNTQTSNYSIVADDVGQHFNNIGAAGAIEISLPPASDGYNFGFAVVEPEYVKITADGSDIIGIGADATGGGGYVRSNVPYSFIKIESHGGGAWIVSSMVGAWGIDV